MTPAILEKAGLMLFGDLWRDPMAFALGNAPRTMRRWMAGDDLIPPNVGNELAEVCETRAQELLGMAVELRAAAADDAASIKSQIVE